MPRWIMGEWGTIDPLPVKEYRTSHKPVKKAFVWPHGGKRRSTWGRLKDLVTSKGPDIFIAFNPNHTPGAVDGPSLGRWTGWGAAVDSEKTAFMDRWNYLGNAGGCSHRQAAEKYDFRTRRYRIPEEGNWMLANYYPEGKLPSSVLVYPGSRNPLHPLGDTPFMDPRNFNSDFLVGIDGGGGDWHPAMALPSNNL